jgi:hypothetical protein
MKRIDLKAVHEKDLPQLLASLGILEQVKQGGVACMVCGTAVNLENIFAIVPAGSEVSVVCTRAACIDSTTHPQAPASG